MFTGSYNTELPLTKLCITKLDKPSEKIYALYNPQEYELTRQARYSSEAGMDVNAPSIQFISGSSESLKFQLFFDTMSAGGEAGIKSTGQKLEANSKKTQAEKEDVREYTEQIYSLMTIDPHTHVPPMLRVEWSSLQFTCHLVSCSQRFTRFNQNGTPVRAVLDVLFLEYIKPSEIAEEEPKNSPDTSKYRIIKDGDSLWALASKEYGDSANWRYIAEANGISNPRLLRTGDTVRLPAID